MKTYFKKERSKEEISRRLFIKTSYKNNMKRIDINNTFLTIIRHNDGWQKANNSFFE